MFTLLLSAHLAAAAAPSSVSVVYVTTFDLDKMADQVCPQTGLCDCTVRYEGSGTLIESTADRWTFEGTWAVSDGACHDALMLWSGGGKAYHTLRFSDGGSTITEWIAHKNASDTTRLTQNIKAGGQVYLYQLAAVVSDGVATHSETEKGQAGPLGMTSTHSLTIQLK